MGLLSAITGSAFDPLVEKVTSEENTSEDWALIMDICDRVAVDANGPKEILRSLIKRLNSPIPGVVMQCLTLIDAMVNNCGKRFHLEVCSRDFETELRRLIGPKTPHPKVSERTRLLIKKWAGEFKNDPQLSLIPSLYEKLKGEGVSFNSSDPPKRSDTLSKNPDAVSSNQEEADILKAIELSLRDAKSSGASSKSYASAAASASSNSSSATTTATSTVPSLYSFNLLDQPSSNGTTASQNHKSNSAAKEPIKVRALYDFEAAEDNELTFKAGEIILVLDNSDANWWKGSNHRGEGLFPANFVSTDLNAEPDIPITSSHYKSEKKVQFNEEVKVKVLDNNSAAEHGKDSATETVPEVVAIDENRIDRLLHLLHEADPQSGKCDSDELLTLEEQCIAMMPLIDEQIQTIDKRHASLTSLNHQLNSAFNLYHDLMKESLMMNSLASANYMTGPVVGPMGVDPYQQQSQQQQQPGQPQPGQQFPIQAGQYQQPVQADPSQIPYSGAAGQQQQPGGGAQYYSPQHQQPQGPGPYVQQGPVAGVYGPPQPQQQPQHNMAPPQQSLPSQQQQQGPQAQQHPVQYQQAPPPQAHQQQQIQQQYQSPTHSSQQNPAEAVSASSAAAPPYHHQPQYSSSPYQQSAVESAVPVSQYSAMAHHHPGAGIYPPTMMAAAATNVPNLL